MKTFLLIHGSWHGAWCWHKIQPRIEAEGNRAIAIDLPGRGRAPCAPALVGLGTMVRACERALPEGQTTVVVHSRYGIVASALAERVPQKIGRIIYLASFLLPSGKRVVDYVPDHESMMPANVVINRLAMWDRLEPRAYREALYADCSPDDVALASALLVREPVRPALSRLRLSDDRYGRVPKAYIRLTEDRAVSPALQDRLLGKSKIDRVESIAASHSAYFSQPDLLTKTILRLAGS